MDLDLGRDSMAPDVQRQWDAASRVERVGIDCQRASALKTVWSYVASHATLTVGDASQLQEATRWLQGDQARVWTSSSSTKASIHLNLPADSFALRDFTSDRLLQHCVWSVVAKLVADPDSGRAIDMLVGLETRQLLLLWDSVKQECAVDMAPPSRSHASQIRLATFEKPKPGRHEHRLKARLPLAEYESALEESEWELTAARTVGELDGKDQDQQVQQRVASCPGTHGPG